MFSRRRFLKAGALLPMLPDLLGNSMLVGAQGGVAKREPVLDSFADFESGTYAGWTLEGNCWGMEPASEAVFPGKITGYQGKRFVCTLHPSLGTGAMGRAISREFTIVKPFIQFRIGGGFYPKEACLNLVVDAKVVRTHTGNGSSVLELASWNVTELRGHTAHFEIVDATQGAERGYIMVDEIGFSGHSPITWLHEMPTTGVYQPSLQSFDDLIIERMKANDIPGAALAIAKDGRLVYARGYGYGNTEAEEVVEPTSLFRLASVSKPITGIAVMKLAQDSRYRLNLDTPVFAFLGLKPFLKAGAQEDPRIWSITIRHLLHHTGGWNRDKSGDIMFKHFQIASEMGVASPPSHEELIRWAMGQPLDFDPGQEYAYSNFGFCVLGRVIEKVTGLSYEKYVQQHVLAPLGITRMHIGNGRRRERVRDEVVYYAKSGGSERSVFSADGQTPVPHAYAFNSPQVMDAHGGWIASPIDLMRFVAVLDTKRSAVLSPESYKTLISRPAPPVALDKEGKGEDVYYGLGWQVRELHDGTKVNMWHSGGMPGTATILVHLATGLSWALLFNRDNGGDMDGLLHQANRRVQHWAEHDLFSQYP